MIVAYYRVSTQRQGRSGLGLDAQRQAVTDYATRTGEQVLAEETEVESGRCRSRPQLAAAVARCRATRATLVVAKLDRLARDTRMILDLADSGVRIVFLDLPASDDPIVGRLLLTVMAAFAQFEAERIAQRCREAAAARRSRGLPMGWVTRRDGRNPLTEEHRRAGALAGAAALGRLHREYAAAMRPIVTEMHAGSPSLAETARRMNAAGYVTRRGRPWTYATVWRVLH